MGSILKGGRLLYLEDKLSYLRLRESRRNQYWRGGVAGLQITTEQRASGQNFVWKSPQLGAATSVLLATSPLLNGIGGRYFEDCNEARPHMPGTRTGVASYALDPEADAHLWQVSIDALS